MKKLQGGFDLYCGDGVWVYWRFGPHPGWSEIDQEGRKWERIGPMTEKGRHAVLKHFHLTHDMGLPLRKLQNLSPEELARIAREHGHRMPQHAA